MSAMNQQVWAYREREWASSQQPITGYSVDATDGSIGKIDEAKITFLVRTAHMAVAGALLLAAGLGALLAFLIAYGRQLQFRRALRREHKRHNA